MWKKTTAIFALYWTISMGVGPRVGYAVELLVPGQPAPGRGIFFHYPSAERLLDEVEECRVIQDENTALKALNENYAQKEELRKEREELFRERIRFLEQQQTELIRINEQAIKTADLVRKNESGSWLEKARDNMIYILGAVLLGMTLAK